MREYKWLLVAPKVNTETTMAAPGGGIIIAC
jgi:hypothetical protein